MVDVSYQPPFGHERSIALGASSLDHSPGTGAHPGRLASSLFRKWSFVGGLPRAGISHRGRWQNMAADFSRTSGFVEFTGLCPPPWSGRVATRTTQTAQEKEVGK